MLKHFHCNQLSLYFFLQFSSFSKIYLTVGIIKHLKLREAILILLPCNLFWCKRPIQRGNFLVLPGEKLHFSEVQLTKVKHFCLCRVCMFIVRQYQVTNARNVT